MFLLKDIKIKSRARLLSERLIRFKALSQLSYYKTTTETKHRWNDTDLRTPYGLVRKQRLQWDSLSGLCCVSVCVCVCVGGGALHNQLICCMFSDLTSWRSVSCAPSDSAVRYVSLLDDEPHETRQNPQELQHMTKPHQHQLLLLVTSEIITITLFTWANTIEELKCHLMHWRGFVVHLINVDVSVS